MATADAPTVPVAPHLAVPGSYEQVTKLARYQLREYLRSLRFIVLLGIVAIIGAIITTIVGYYHTTAASGLVSNTLAFYGSLWGGGVNAVVVLSAVFFGGDAIAGEFQNKTGYFLMGLPVRRTTVYLGKYIAAFLASCAMLALFLAILVGNGAAYFGVRLFPWQLGASVLLALVYLGSVLGATFLFSSLFKTSLYGFVLTLIMFLFGFSVLQGLIVGLVNIEPWMVISYASTTMQSVFASPVNWGLTASVGHTMINGLSVGPRVYTAGVAEGVVIMVGYLLVTALAGLGLFEREEFA